METKEKNEYFVSKHSFSYGNARINWYNATTAPSVCKTQNLSPYYWGSNALQPQAFALQPRHSCDKPQLLAETLSTIFFSFFQIFDKQPRHSCPHRFARVGFSQEAGCCSSQGLKPKRAATWPLCGPRKRLLLPSEMWDLFTYVIKWKLIILSTNNPQLMRGFYLVRTHSVWPYH